MKKPLDKNGRKIEVGDTLKIFHFIGARRKKHYMYKYVDSAVTFGGWDFYKVLHLNPEGDHYHIALNGAKHDDIEIVQGYGADGKNDFEYRVKL